MKYTISGGGYTAVIDLARGGNCVALRHEKTGARILREPDERLLENPHLYGMPILFPVNRIAGGAFFFEGREYRFPVNEPSTGCHLHGTLHETPFVLREQTENRLICAYRAPYLSFPHDFEVVMDYSLSARGLIHRVEVINRSATNMPCMLGFHTTFNTQFTESSKPEDIRAAAAVAEEYARGSDFLPTGETRPADAVTEQLRAGAFSPFGLPVSRHYRACGRMALRDSARRLAVIYEPDEKLAFRLIYNGNASGFICMEPQTCLVNAPNLPIPPEESGFDFIPPGERRTYISRLFMEEENQ